jgi:acetyl-CoA C-acetyltransferase
MPSLNPRVPVLIGAGQVTARDGAGPEPFQLLSEAAERAAEDCGSTRALDAIDSIRVVRMFTRSYRDPGRLVAERLGRPDATTVYTAGGGNMPQLLVDRAATDILEGRSDVVLIGGAESWRTRARAKADGRRLDWAVQDESVEPDSRLGDELHFGSPLERSIGLHGATTVYPLFEVALRHRAGLSPESHRRLIGDLWARFSAVAAGNPHAAIRKKYSSEEIVAPSPTNRMISYPYTKLLSANNSVDQGAALLMCSVERARAMGVPADRWVFLHGAAEADDTKYISNRREFWASDPIRLCGEAALTHAGRSIDEIAYFDLYSCFPSAVQVAAAELGVSLDRELTVTGGLTFAGGPWNNYVTHAIAAMMNVLREDPDAYGLCSANGGALTKQAVGVYSCRPTDVVRWSSVQDLVDANPTVPVVDEWHGTARVETYTVDFDREGAPAKGFVAARTADGSRAWATTQDARLMAALVDGDWCERACEIDGVTLSGLS